jgi:hypothetical protein
VPQLRRSVYLSIKKAERVSPFRPNLEQAAIASDHPNRASAATTKHPVATKPATIMSEGLRILHPQYEAYANTKPTTVQTTAVAQFISFASNLNVSARGELAPALPTDPGPSGRGLANPTKALAPEKSSLYSLGRVSPGTTCSPENRVPAGPQGGKAGRGPRTVHSGGLSTIAEQCPPEVPPYVRRRNWRRTTGAPHRSRTRHMKSSDSATTGMPHRPASSDGQPPVFAYSNPTGRR